VEATFFACRREDAIGVSSIDDLPCDPAGESIRIESPGIMTALAKSVCGPSAKNVEPLRDATCRSFPVFEFSKTVSDAISDLSDARVDEVSQVWFADPNWRGADIDLHELGCLLADIRGALSEQTGRAACLFVLLEEKAL
jgi:hypothetical protein